MKQGVIIVSTLLLVASGCSTTKLGRDSSVDTVRKFIDESWETTVRYNPVDTGTLIGLPHPYTVPSPSNTFQEMYYWDTFFASEGMVLDGHLDQYKNNTDNLLYEVDKFGKVFNGNRSYYANRSQPPYLSMMVDRVYSYTKDKEWLQDAYVLLEKEYSFWMKERISPIGLNHFSSSADEALKQEFVDTGGKRLNTNFRDKGLTDQQILRLGEHFAAEAESGWDFNPRFKRRCEDFCPIDLNSNLYIYETNFAKFAKELGLTEATADWNKKADDRRRKILEYCWSENDGIFYDYDYVNNQRSDVVSAAVFSLLYANIPDQKQAARLVNALDKLEFEYGIAACENKKYDYPYQWSYPNAWAPLQYLTVRGLHNYGYDKEAKRVSEKYIGAVTKTFDQTHNLWEKYNVREGSINVTHEYETPTMMGWSAGVYVYLTDYLAGRVKD